MIVASNMLETSDVTSASSRGVGTVMNKTPNALITTVKFDGSNYLPWFHSTQLYITGKGKFGIFDRHDKVSRVKVCHISKVAS